MTQQQDRLTYPHRHFDVITRINELLDILENNKAVYSKKEANKVNCEGMAKLIEGIEDLEKLREIIANQIQW
jgi:hypothetical protein